MLIMPILIMLAVLIAPSGVLAANYPLKTLIPRAVGTSPDAGGATITSGHRIFWAYPGIDYSIVASVIGGAYPYTYSLPSGAPTGMTINSSTGVITWTGANVSGGPYTPTFRVVDAEGTQVETTWTVTVDSTKFLFLDQVNGTRRSGNGCSSSCGTGTLANPWKDISDWYGPNSLNGAGNTYESKTNNANVGKLVYYRTGTYPMDAYIEDGWRMPVLGNYKPVAHMAYPGEAPVIDQTNGATLPGGSWSFYLNHHNTFMDGLTFVSTTNPTLQNVISYQEGNFQVFTRNTWGDVYNTQNGANAACLLFGSSQSGPIQNFSTVRLNTCDGVHKGAGFKLYSIYSAVIADNTILNVSDTIGSDVEGIALKYGIDRADVRNNLVHDVTNQGIGGNQNSGAHLTRNVEIRYNRVYNTSGGSALQLNQNGNAGVMHVERNTFLGRIEVQSTDAADGPFYFSNNVHATTATLGGCKADSRIQCVSVTDPSRIILSAAPNGDISPTPSDNCTTSLGVLQNGGTAPWNTCRDDYLGLKGHEISGAAPPPPPAAPMALTVADTPGDGGTQLTLSWTPSGSAGVTEQRTYRGSASGGPYSLVTTISGNVTATAIDGNLLAGTTYFYIVRAYNGATDLESANSNEASGVPVVNPTPPVSVPAASGSGIGQQ